MGTGSGSSSCGGIVLTVAEDADRYRRVPEAIKLSGGEGGTTNRDWGGVTRLLEGLAGGYALKTLYSNNWDLSIVVCSLKPSDRDSDIEFEC